MTSTGRRLIEDALPIAAINEVAQREKIGHAAIHPRKLHLWWARRPLAAARAAVYAALVPAEGRPRTAEEEAEFFRALCEWGASDAAIAAARADVLDANGGVPPKVVDLFAGGGAIPLEAARLGCEATAIELNPVAHLIEKAMLELPAAHPGIADDIRRYGQQWVDRAWKSLADLYPPVDEPGGDPTLYGDETGGRRPLAYLWTRTVRCPNPATPEHQVHLVRQTWLARKKGRAVALRPIVDRDTWTVTYEVATATSADALGFDPADGSKRGQTTCRLCGATVTAAYVKAEGTAGRMGIVSLAAVVLKKSGRGRDYLPAGTYPLPDEDDIVKRLADLPVQPPEEKLVTGDTMNIKVPLYGLTRFRDLFTPRQLLTLCTLAAGIREMYDLMIDDGMTTDRAAAIATYFGLALDRVVDRSSVLCRWEHTNETAMNTYARQALPMVWDFVEPAPFGGAAGDVREMTSNVADIAASLSCDTAHTSRTSATSVPLGDLSQDAVITDPPYYDNISYADLSDFFYVWLKRSIGWLYPDDFGGELTPKRNEAVVAAYRHQGHKDEARAFYEDMMAKAFAEAHRVLKPDGVMVCIYAHKTTLGWSTLVDALRRAGFVITEAWPLDTEMPERSVGQGTASLASSIFLVARKRASDAGIGDEGAVLAELDEIIAERLERLQAMGITGSDLVIATVGAGLRALTRYERVEQANGETLPADRFLTMVQGRVLDRMFGALQGADAVTRYYAAAQFSYGYAAVPFDEANNLARVAGVDLDTPQGLTSGRNALCRKEKSSIALRDFDERGDDPKLGLPSETGLPAPLVDVAHGLLWRAENQTAQVRPYLLAVRPDLEQLRQLLQTLAGPALRAPSPEAKPAESAAAERLLVSWRRLTEDGGLL